MSCVLVGVPRNGGAELLYAISDRNHLAVFDLSTPGTPIVDMPVTGLQPNENLVAIDFRPRTQQLYAISRNSVEGLRGRLYRIHILTGVATPIGPPGPPALPTGDGPIGFDISPVDEARVITSLSGNYRVDLETGLMIDGDSVTPGLQPDTPIAREIAAIAYANNFTGAPGSTLYGIDMRSRALLRIGGAGGTPSPSDGGTTPLGTVSFPPSVDVGFDITTPGNRAYVVAHAAAGEVDLFQVEIATPPLGRVTHIGRFPLVGGRGVRHIAILNAPAIMFAVTSSNHLLRFRSEFPRLLQSDVPITGTVPGTVRAIDVRPATGELYAITELGMLCTLDVDTGVLTAVGPVGETWDESTAMSFDPISGLLRLTRASGANRRVDVTTTPITVAWAFNTRINGEAAPGPVGLAHAVNPVTGASTLYGINRSVDKLLRIGGPGDVPSVDDGVMTPIGEPWGGIAGPGTAFEIDTRWNTAYASVPSGLGEWGLFRLDLVGRPPVLLGIIGGNLTPDVRAIAIAPTGLVRFTRDTLETPETGGTITVTVERVGKWDEGVFAVDYAARATGTATAGSDFTAVSGTLAFRDGERTKTIAIPIVNDAIAERSIETFTLALETPQLGAQVVTPSTMAISIRDDESVSNQKPTITITSPTTAPAFETSSGFLELAGTASDDAGVAQVTWTDQFGGSGTAQGTTQWIIPAYEVLDNGPFTITVTAHDTLGETTSATLVVTQKPFLTYVLAEGATGGFFDLDILLANIEIEDPEGSPIDVTLTFLKEDGTTVTHAISLPQSSRRTVRVDEIPGLDSTSVSTIVTAPRPIVVERTMRWAEGKGYGAHTEKAVGGPASTWYFAEGSQGFFSTYLLLANPHTTENTATVEYLREFEPPVTRTYALLPNSRLTVDAGADDALVNRSFGMIVTFATPGVAERAMYFGGNPLWKAGHESAGVNTPSPSWFLAEGATGPFFETFVLLSNPQETAADVTLTFLVADGEPITKTKTVPGRSRLTVNIEQEDPALANVAVATAVASSVPIVVERAQYWPFSFDEWYEAHNSFGVIAPSRGWALAEGRVGGADGYETYILLANPGAETAEVQMMFVRTAGAPLIKRITVPARSRVNVTTGPGSLVPELVNEEFGVSIDSSAPIVVERAMYASSGGLTWSAGTNATATRIGRL